MTAMSAGRTIYRWFALAYLASLAVGLWVVSDPAFTQPQAVAITSILYVIPILVASVLGLVAVRRTTGQEHRFWAWLSVAIGAIAVSEIWVSHLLVRHGPSGVALPQPFELLHVVAAVAMLISAAQLTWLGREPLLKRAAAQTDVLSVGLIAWSIVSITVTPAIFAGTGVSHAVPRIAAGYLVYGVVLLGLAAMLLLPAYRRVIRWVQAAAISLAVYGIGMLTWPWSYREMLTDPSAASSVGVFSVAAAGGFYLLAAAIADRLVTPAVVLVPRPPASVRWWVTSLSTILLAVAVPVVGAVALFSEGTPDADMLLYVALTVAVPLTLRSWPIAVERSRAARRVARDPQTGLPTLRKLRDDLDEAIRRARSLGTGVWLLVGDVDDMYRIIDVQGAEAGSRTVESVARALRSAKTSDECLYRIGSDEFALVTLAPDPRGAVTRAREAAEVVSKRVTVGGTGVGLSFGVSTYPEDARTSEELLEHALAAQRAATQAGTGEPVRYDPAALHEISPNERVRRARQRARRSALRTLAAAVEARDASTIGHSQGVADLVTRLGEVLGLEGERVRELELAATLHDVGRIGVPTPILSRTDPLGDDERRSIEEHTVLGERIVASAGLADIAQWIRWHHERWDGAGYPDGLAAGDIPLESRILAVCDAFEAMTRGAPWKPPMPLDEAIAELRAQAGRQFDPRLAEALERLVVGMRAAHQH